MIKKGEYQGKPVISLLKKEDDRFPFTFGHSKAKMILENLEEIKAFVAECEKNTP
jgi:hypothetical protein